MDAAGGPADRPGTSYAAMASPSGLTMIAGYADGIGPNKVMVIPRATLGRLGKPTALVRDAHAAGIKVHPWPFRRENYFLPLSEARKGVRVGKECVSTGSSRWWPDH